MLYYSFKNIAFYDDEIHTAEQIPADAVEISEGRHAEMLSAINSGCLILDDLTLTPPKPSKYHQWLDGAWVITEEMEELKQNDVNAAKQTEISALLSLAAQRISEYQDLLDFSETPEEAAAGEAGYNAWRQYRASLLKYQKGLIADMPLQPE